MIKENSSQARPYAETDAAQMLRKAVAQMQARGVSLRQLAKNLDYKQATVLSQMANGRVRIPMKKAGEIARATEIPPAAFIIAVAEQHQAEDFTSSLLMEPTMFLPPDGFADELELISGVPLNELSDEQKKVMREVVAQTNPNRRWLEPAEVPVIQLLRTLRPRITTDGLTQAERTALRKLFI